MTRFDRTVLAVGVLLLVGAALPTAAQVSQPSEPDQIGSPAEIAALVRYASENLARRDASIVLATHAEFSSPYTEFLEQVAEASGVKTWDSSEHFRTCADRLRCAFPPEIQPVFLLSTERRGRQTVVRFHLGGGHPRVAVLEGAGTRVEVVCEGETDARACRAAGG